MKIHKRWILVSCVLLVLFLYPIGSFAWTNSIPYAESFESYTNGFQLFNTNGWYADKPDSLTVITNWPSYTNEYMGGEVPLTNVPHTLIASLDGSVTNAITNSITQSEIYVDMMINPTRWVEDDPPTISNNLKVAIYFNSNGNPVVYGAYGYQGQWQPEEGTNWLTSSSFTVATDQWVRLTVDLQLSKPAGEEWFRVRLDGVPLVFEKGADIVQSTNKPGPWLQVANTSAGKINSCGFSGTGRFDDMQVITNNPIIGQKYTVLVLFHPPGSMEVYNPVGDNWRSSDFSISFYDDHPPMINAQAIPQNATCTKITNAVLINLTDSTTNNMNDYISEDLYFDYQIPPGPTNYILKLFAEYQYRTLVIASNTASLPFTANPPLGTYSNLYRYNDILTCTSADLNPLNTSTARHYCTWTRVGSNSSSGDGTNTTFTLRDSPTTVTWNWRLQHVLGTEKTGEPGFLQTDAMLSPSSGWYYTNSNVTVTATGYGGWTNSYWYGSTNGCSFPANNKITAPMSVPRPNIGCYFVYVPSATNRNLIVVSDYGTPSPSVGTNSYPDGANLICTLSGSPIISSNTQFVCTGWIGTGRVPSSGSGTNTGLFKLTTDSSITWQWQVNYWLDTEVIGNGTVDIEDNWYISNTVVYITASGIYGGVFQEWTGDTNGCTINGDTILVPMTQARNITAVFTGDELGTYGTPGSWLLRYGITNFATVSEAETDDTDGDLKLNWEEYVHGTDPTNNLSVCRIFYLTAGSTSNLIVWYATTNSGVLTPFSIKRSTNLISGTWEFIESNTIPRNYTGTNVWIDTNLPPNAPVFYYPLVIWTNGP